MNYINAIERYHEYKKSIHELIGSIVTGIVDVRILKDEGSLTKAMKWLHQNYPFVELAYILDGEGIQITDNISYKSLTEKPQASGKGVDRRHRPYYKQIIVSDNVIVTKPYLSTASHKLCISSAAKCIDNQGEIKGILVIDIDLATAIEFLMGDSKRKKFQPFFIVVYSLISLGLFVVVGVLLYAAGIEIASLFSDDAGDLHLKPFGIIIFLTLALAIFDLGKTTLEEEVLMHKDIFRHSSTRRTITRFIAAILIAVSIESLLLMFKSVLGSPEYLHSAVAMMAASVGLLVGLGIYVYLGARAESILKRSNRKK